jgi:hypothetical protein
MNAQPNRGFVIELRDRFSDQVIAALRLALPQLFAAKRAP